MFFGKEQNPLFIEIPSSRSVDGELQALTHLSLSMEFSKTDETVKVLRMGLPTMEHLSGLQESI